MIVFLTNVFHDFHAPGNAISSDFDCNDILSQDRTIPNNVVIVIDNSSPANMPKQWQESEQEENHLSGSSSDL